MLFDEKKNIKIFELFLRFVLFLLINFYIIKVNKMEVEKMTKQKLIAVTPECNEYLDAIKWKYGKLKGIAVEEAIKKTYPEIAELVEMAREGKKR